MMELNVSEPVAGNYYPINTMAAIDDGETEFAVLTEVQVFKATRMI